jgi:HEAT repeat protein
VPVLGAHRWMSAYRAAFAFLLATSIITCACSRGRPKPVEKKTTEELLEDLANGDDRVKIAAVRRLGVLKGQTAVGALLVALKDPSEGVQLAAVNALGESKDSEAVEAVWTLVNDPKRNRDLRFAAARALCNLGDVRAAGPLTQALPYAYHDASACLLALGKAAVPALVDGIRVSETRDGASKVLVAMGTTGVEPLIQLLRSNEIKSARMGAASTLAEIEDPRAEMALNEALKDGDPEMTWAAYRYLIRKGQPGTESALIKALNTYGKLTMAEDYAASGNAALKSAGEEWARRRNYDLTTRTSEMGEVHWAGVDPSLKRLGLYHFDGTLTSTSGTAPAQSNGISFVPGKWGKALSVDKGGILKYPLKDNLSFRDGTIEMWISVKLDGADPIYTKYNHALLLYHSPGGQFVVSGSTLGRFYAGSVVRQQFKGAGGGSITDWKPGTWHYIAFTYSSHPPRQRFYVDGVLTSEINGPMPEPNPEAGTFTVGCDPYGNWAGFAVDELQIWNGEKPQNLIRKSALQQEPFADR